MLKYGKNNLFHNLHEKNHNKMDNFYFIQITGNCYILKYKNYQVNRNLPSGDVKVYINDESV